LSIRSDASPAREALRFFVSGDKCLPGTGDVLGRDWQGTRLQHFCARELQGLLQCLWIALDSADGSGGCPVPRHLVLQDKRKAGSWFIFADVVRAIHALGVAIYSPHPASIPAHRAGSLGHDHGFGLSLIVSAAALE